MKQNSEDALGSRRMPTKCKIHSGEVQRERVSLARAKSWPQPARPALCDEASAAMQEHGFWQASCFAEYRLLRVLG
ncbi:hypothetical protein DP120_05255 [Planococcus halotolerans]|uniref:Uncharacterized protein n=1 Tax=Planococcus halotolerans TaxID=2233542 RepID=A0A365L0Y4_9BACL|nr:hypothetical protein DP120_05255 [Planococcus halotolerans]